MRKPHPTRNGRNRRCYGTSAESAKTSVATKTGIILKGSRRRIREKQSALDAIIERCAKKLIGRNRELERLTAQGPVAGSIWSTCPQKEEDLFGPLVLVLQTPDSGREALWVAEVTQDRKRCEDGDIRLSRRSSGLHFCCTIRVSVLLYLEPQKLLTCAGKLSGQQTRSIVSVMCARLNAGFGAIISDKQES